MIIIEPVKNLIKNHITRSRINSVYNTKALIVSAALLDIYGNTVDCIKIYNNKAIPDEQKKYLVSYKMVNGLVSAILETVAGFLITNKETQEKLSNFFFKSIKNNNPELFSQCSKGLMIFSSIVISTVMVKRLIAPVIITPIASFIKKNFLSEAHSDSKNLLRNHPFKKDRFKSLNLIS